MLTLVVVLTGGFAVTMRNNMINLLGEDYIVMGRAKGLSDQGVMLWYAARNALLPTVSALAISLGAVLGGSLVTEVVFNYPGMGNTLYQAILARDYPVIQGAAADHDGGDARGELRRRPELRAARSATEAGLSR